MQQVRNGESLQQVVKQMAGNNPQYAEFVKMIEGKSNDDIIQTAQNMAQSMGVDYNQLTGQIRGQMGM